MDGAHLDRTIAALEAFLLPLLRVFLARNAANHATRSSAKPVKTRFKARHRFLPFRKKSSISSFALDNRSGDPKNSSKRKADARGKLVEQSQVNLPPPFWCAGGGKHRKVLD
jgi:hypothetical protein